MPLNMRTTRELREKLEKNAANSGRSLAQEVEYRLEQSFRDEEALGGRQLHALFGLLGNAAALIEEQTGKSCFEHFSIWLAVQGAWQHLIVGFGPKLPDMHVAARNEAAAVARPKMPETLPAPPGPLVALDVKTPGEFEEKINERERAWKRFARESAKYFKAGEMLRRVLEVEEAQMEWGKDFTASLLPKKPEK